MQDRCGLNQGQKDPQRTTHSSILISREIPWTEEPGGLGSMGTKERHDWHQQQQYLANTAAAECGSIREAKVNNAWYAIAEAAISF